MTQLILIRHGETVWNAQQRLQGHSDIALNAQGLEQAAALARALAHETIDAVIASDLLRARQTAQQIADQCGLSLQQIPSLRERCYGAFEGLTYAEIAARYPAEYAAWQRRDIDSVMPAGERQAESFFQFNQRVLGALYACGARHRGQTIVVVAHGGVLECAYRAAHALPLAEPRQFSVLNASINRFVIDGDTLQLRVWGEIGHLAGRVMNKLI